MTTTFLVAIDGSEGSLRATNCAVERARAGQADLVLAYVIEWSPYSFNTPEELAQRHQRREEEIARAHKTVLDPVTASLKDKGVKVGTDVRHGHAAETLVELAKEHDAAQIFIGRKGESRMKTLLFGSVAGTLVQISPVPVTVVP